MWLVARGALGWAVWLPGTALLRGMLLGAGGRELPGAPSSCALRCDLTRAVLGDHGAAPRGISRAFRGLFPCTATISLPQALPSLFKCLT